MSQHTPGPWHAWDRGIGWEVHPGLECSDACDSCINEGFRDTFSEADARLIAAAPELLEACKGVLRFPPDFKSARMAVAKAEGRNQGTTSGKQPDSAGPTGEESK